VPDANAEDVAQQAFCVLAQRLAEIAPGAERAFLLTTAWRVASEHRRAARRRPTASDGEIDELATPLPLADELVDQKRARGVLQDVLDAMPEDLRVVFVLYEIEELSLKEIASATGLRLGTATSRLRRAREVFESTLKRRSAVSLRAGGGAR
jgi:RNA polymerase sigma-70 factor (ECF subfamily)